MSTEQPPTARDDWFFAPAPVLARRPPAAPSPEPTPAPGTAAAAPPAVAPAGAAHGVRPGETSFSRPAPAAPGAAPRRAAPAAADDGAPRPTPAPLPPVGMPGVAPFAASSSAPASVAVAPAAPASVALASPAPAPVLLAGAPSPRSPLGGSAVGVPVLPPTPAGVREPPAAAAASAPAVAVVAAAPAAVIPAPRSARLAPEPEPEPAPEPATPSGTSVAPGPSAPSEAAGSTRRAFGSTEETVTTTSLNELLVDMLERGASDLHVTAGAKPMVRRAGSLEPLDPDLPVLDPPEIQRMIYAVLTQKQREKFEEELELDFAYALPGHSRFRVNIYRQRGALGAAFRMIPYEIRPLEQLGVPASVSNFAMLARGFVLVTGPTGSGKSTTLASLVDLANRQRRDHIMTCEDPIEFLHSHQSCVVNQREVGEDTWGFANALKHVLRQDPDIILVGEMRDLETISVALTAAETGHLVFATLHTQDAAQTIDRVIDVFPPHQQQQVRVQLAGALQGVVCQTLVKTPDGRGRVVAAEVLTVTPAIRNLIREGKTHQIYSAIQAGARHGMVTMDQTLAELVKRGRITYDAGLEKCHHVEDFNRLAGRA